MAYISADRSHLEALVWKWTLAISRERFSAETPDSVKLPQSLEIAKGEMSDVLSRFTLADCKFSWECEQLEVAPHASASTSAAAKAASTGLAWAEAKKQRDDRVKKDHLKKG